MPWCASLFQSAIGEAFIHTGNVSALYVRCLLLYLSLWTENRSFVPHVYELLLCSSLQLEPYVDPLTQRRHRQTQRDRQTQRSKTRRSLEQLGLVVLAKGHLDGQGYNQQPLKINII